LSITVSKILAVDPGKRCGLFVYNLITGTWRAQEDDPYTIIHEVDVAIADIHVACYVVAERFTMSGAVVTQQPDALETIGALRYVTRRRHQGDITLQSRAVKSRVPNSTLRTIGWWHDSEGGHSLDAARHALVFLVEKFPHTETVRRLMDRIKERENGEIDDEAHTGVLDVQGSPDPARPHLTGS